jgi:hypothetical protein
MDQRVVANLADLPLGPENVKGAEESEFGIRG